MTSSNHESLVESLERARLCQGSEAAQLLDGYRDYLRLLAQTSMADWMRAKADPSDLVQDTMLHAVRHFGDFRGRSEAELAQWLRSILVQQLTELARRFRSGKRSVEREVSLQRLVERSSQTCQQLAAPRESSSDAHGEQRDAGVLIAEVLARLPADQREVVVLRSLKQLRWDDVGRLMNRSPDAARLLWVRTLKRIRKLFQERQS